MFSIKDAAKNLKVSQSKANELMKQAVQHAKTTKQNGQPRATAHRRTNKRGH